MHSMSLNIVVIALGAVVILMAADSLLTLLSRDWFTNHATEAGVGLQEHAVQESAADGGYVDNEQGKIAA